jgi:hypothetical protein
MSRNLAPCKGCPERKPHCHGSCAAYIEYDKKNQAVRELRAMALRLTTTGKWEKDFTYSWFIKSRLGTGETS